MTLKTKIITFVNEHQIPVIIGSFLLLPVVILGSLLLFSKIKNRSTADISVTPTLTITVRPEPTEKAEEEEEDEEPTATPTKKLTQSPTPKATQTPGASNPTNTPGPTSTPTKQANVVFQTVNCMYTPVASPSGEKKKINDTSFASSSDVPSNTTCDIEFKNVEDTETGDITYALSSDSDQKKITVGKLKKDETKKVTEVVELKRNAGSHYVKVLLNPDKTFSETDYNDNTYQANYNVQ